MDDNIWHELRMMVELGHCPTLCVISDTDKKVGNCVDTEAEVVDGVVYVRGSYQVEETFYAMGAVIELPSGAEIDVPFEMPNEVTAGQWIDVQGNVRQ